MYNVCHPLLCLFILCVNKRQRIPMGNPKWCVHKTKTNKAKTQHNLCIIINIEFGAF